MSYSTSPEDQPIPRGYDIATEQRIAQNIQSSILADINLRQWCIEKSIACGSTDVVGGAKLLMDFLVQKEKAPGDGALS